MLYSAHLTEMRPRARAQAEYAIWYNVRQIRYDALSEHLDVDFSGGGFALAVLSVAQPDVGRMLAMNALLILK